MYGTVARMRIKAGMEDQFMQTAQAMESVKAPGQVGVIVYQMDRSSREFMLAVVFEDRQSYHANAQSPEQHERFMQMAQYMESEPEWNDGEIVYSQF